LIDRDRAVAKMNTVSALIDFFKTLKNSSLVIDGLLTAYCSVVFFLSITSHQGAVALNKHHFSGFRLDYLLHVLMFIPFMVLAHWRWSGERRSMTRMRIALGAGLAFAAISEGVQWLLPYRTFNWLDLWANCLGVVTGALIAWWGRSKTGVSS
jgi:glycopeptide antibiotics resistance protein